MIRNQGAVLWGSLAALACASGVARADDLDVKAKREQYADTLPQDVQLKAIESLMSSGNDMASTISTIPLREWVVSAPRERLFELQQVVDSNRPAPAPCASCPGGVKTKQCDENLSTDDKIASAFVRDFASALNAVAQIQIKWASDQDFHPVATAVAVSNGWLATNYHVATAFTNVSNGQRRLRRDVRVALVFNRAVDSPGNNERIELPESTLFFGAVEPDIVVFHVPEAESIAPVQLLSPTQKVAVKSEVAILGYPQRTADDITTDSTYKAVFGLCGDDDPPAVMRIAVGRVSSVSPKLMYNVNTLPSNSGSPVFRVADGRLVAIHVGGPPSLADLFNEGVPATEIQTALARAIAGTAIVRPYAEGQR